MDSIVRESIYDSLMSFIKQANTNNLKTSSFKTNFMGCRLEVSFGQGSSAKIPWISFLCHGNKTSDGIHPTFLYFKDQNLLILAFGVSESKESKIFWPMEHRKESVKEYFQKSNMGEPFHYGNSYVFRVYNPQKLLKEEVDKDVSEIIEIYKSVVESSTDMPKKWIFQANPKAFDVINFLENSKADYWTVSKFASEIKKGDTVYIWVSGSAAGLYGIAKTTSDIYKLSEGQETIGRGSNVVDIIVQRFLGEGYISRQSFLKNKILKDSSIITQPHGTNFKLSEEEVAEIERLLDNSPTYWLYSPGEKGNKWDEFYEAGIMAIAWDDLGDLSLYPDKESIKKQIHNLRKDQADYKNIVLACYDFAKTIKPGDKVFVKKGKALLIGYGEVLSDYIFDGSKKEYSSIRKVRWDKKGEWSLDTKDFVVKTLTNLDPYPDYVARLQALIGFTEGPTMKKYPLNTILYGPPGTGKTYKAMQKAKELLESQTGKSSRSEMIASITKDLTWKEMIVLVMHRNSKKDGYKTADLKNDEIMTAFATNKTSKNYGGTIYTQIITSCKEGSTELNPIYRREDELFEKDPKTRYWTLTEEGVNLADALSDYDEKLKHLVVSDKSWKDYRTFITFHQSYSYEEFVEGIRPVIEEGLVSYKVIDGVLKQLCQKAENDPNNRYLLIIDEINRGNISKIFGEIITLLEEDKRIGAVNEVKVRLPYSGEEFGMPQNLYILGTMNTADRSIALLDVALRRRFRFEELMPIYEELKSVLIGALNLGELLEKINLRLEVMIDRDHMIGHSFFYKVLDASNKLSKLYEIWYCEVLPLLQEYFYGDWTKLKLLLGEYDKDKGSGFVELDKNIKKRFKETEYDEFYDVVIGSCHTYPEEELLKALINL